MTKQLRTFWYLFIVAMAFFLVEFLFYLTQQSQFFLSTAVLHTNIKVPFAFWPPLIYFWLVLILLHLLLPVVIFFMSYAVWRTFRFAQKQLFNLAVFLLVASILVILFGNLVNYPGSIFSQFLGSVFPRLLAWVIFKLAAAILLISLVIAIIYYAKCLWLKRPYLFCLILALIFLFAGFNWFSANHSRAVQSSQQANVFIIGIDALRPDYSQQPAFKNFMKKAAVFENSITPIGRTHAAWISILTGQWPKQNGVRFDSERLATNKIPLSLAPVLRRHGYITIFATDARAFNYITPALGFNKIIAPPMKVDNVIITAMSDFPIVNLLINTKLGPYLFPYNVNNRDAHITYRPAAYLQQVKDGLSQVKARPIFLGVHFNLAHEPYDWASRPNDDKLTTAGNYALAVKRVDQQFAGLMQYLQQHGYLQHAIVILMSDHGEGLGLPGDRLISQRNYVKGPNSAKDTQRLFKKLVALEGNDGKLNTSAGHGTDVLSMSQYNNVLAVRTYGLPPVRVRKVPNLVSLAQLKPSLLSMLNIPDHGSTLPSLQGYLYQPHLPTELTPIFAETGFTPTALRYMTFSISNTALQSDKLFEVDPKTDLLLMRPAAEKLLLKTNKERAVFYGDWVLAVYPEKQGGSIAVLANRVTGRWTDDLSSSFAKQAPVQLMQQSLEKLYGNEVNF